MFVGTDAWMLSQGKEMSVSMKVHGEAAEEAKRKAKEKAASLASEEEQKAEEEAKKKAEAGGAASTLSMSMLRGSLDDQGEKPEGEGDEAQKEAEEGAQGAAKAGRARAGRSGSVEGKEVSSSKPKVQKVGEDPFISTGKVEVEHLQASMKRLANGLSEFIPEDGGGMDETGSWGSGADGQESWEASFSAADYLKNAIKMESGEGAEGVSPSITLSRKSTHADNNTARTHSFDAEHAPDVQDDATFNSLEQQINHERDVDQYMALVDGEGEGEGGGIDIDKQGPDEGLNQHEQQWEHDHQETPSERGQGQGADIHFIPPGQHPLIFGARLDEDEHPTHPVVSADSAVPAPYRKVWRSLACARPAPAAADANAVDTERKHLHLHLHLHPHLWCRLQMRIGRTSLILRHAQCPPQ